jgi:hypothetical protein
MAIPCTMFAAAIDRFGDLAGRIFLLCSASTAPAL